MNKESTSHPEQRADLELRMLSKEELEARIARSTGAWEQRLYRWREDSLRGGRRALAGVAHYGSRPRQGGKSRAALAERGQVIGALTIASGF